MTVQRAERAKVDTREVIEALEELRELLVALDGTEPDDDNLLNKQRARLNAQRSRKLLYAAHLCDRVKVAVMDEYFVFKGVLT